MDGSAALGQGQTQPQQEQQAAAKVVERLNPAVQQQLNLESVKTRAVSLFKAITRILEDFDHIARTNAVPKWLVSPIQYVYALTQESLIYM